MKENKREINRELTEWVDDVIIPLTDIMGYIEDLEMFNAGFQKEKMFEHDNFQQILSRLMDISRNLMELR